MAIKKGVFTVMIGLWLSAAVLSESGVPFIIDLDVHESSRFGVGFYTENPESVHPINRGIVYQVSDDPDNPTNLGKYVIVRHQEKTADGFFDFYSVYAALSEVTVTAGQTVEQNQILGTTHGISPLTRTMNDTSFYLGLFSFTESPRELADKFGDTHPLYGVFWYDPVRFITGEPPKFDYDSYAPIDMVSLIIAVKSADMRSFNSGNYTYGKLYAELENLHELFMKTTEMDDQIKQYFALVGINDKYRPLFSYYNQYRFDDCSVIFLYQTSLANHLQNLDQNTRLGVYFFFGYTDDSKKQLVCFVNEFEVL